MLMTICVASGGPLAGVCALSVAVTENGNEPIWVGVPDTVPSLPRMSPGGSAPLARHVYGGEPPLAVKPPEYGYVTVPAGGLGDAATTIAESLTVRVTAAVAVTGGYDESVTVTETGYFPAVAGVPDKNPDALSVRPGGRGPDSFQTNDGVPPVAWNE